MSSRASEDSWDERGERWTFLSISLRKYWSWKLGKAARSYSGTVIGSTISNLPIEGKPLSQFAVPPYATIETGADNAAIPRLIESGLPNILVSVSNTYACSFFSLSKAYLSAITSLPISAFPSSEGSIRTCFHPCSPPSTV